MIYILVQVHHTEFNLLHVKHFLTTRTPYIWGGEFLNFGKDPFAHPNYALGLFASCQGVENKIL